MLIRNWNNHFEISYTYYYSLFRDIYYARVYTALELQHIKIKNEYVNQILSVKIDITQMLNTFMLTAVHTLYFHKQLTN